MLCNTLGYWGYIVDTKKMKCYEYGPKFIDEGKKMAVFSIITLHKYVQHKKYVLVIAIHEK